MSLRNRAAGRELSDGTHVGAARGRVYYLDDDIDHMLAEATRCATRSITVDDKRLQHLLPPAGAPCARLRLWDSKQAGGEPVWNCGIEAAARAALDARLALRAQAIWRGSAAHRSGAPIKVKLTASDRRHSPSSRDPHRRPHAWIGSMPIRVTTFPRWRSCCRCWSTPASRTRTAAQTGREPSRRVETAFALCRRRKRW